MNHRAFPVLLAAVLLLGGLSATLVARGWELNTMVGAGIGALLFVVVGGVVAAAG